MLVWNAETGWSICSSFDAKVSFTLRARKSVIYSKQSFDHVNLNLNHHRSKRGYSLSDIGSCSGESLLTVADLSTGMIIVR